MAAAIIALILEANPSLTWRDVQHIIVRTSQPRNLKATDWLTNGMGRKVSHSYGYGLMDTTAMVQLAKNWTLVPRQVHHLNDAGRQSRKELERKTFILFAGEMCDLIPLLLQSHSRNGLRHDRDGR
jgi:furin